MRAIILCIYFSLGSFAQNILYNGGFEEMYSWPKYYEDNWGRGADIELVKGWGNPTDIKDTSNSNRPTPDVLFKIENVLHHWLLDNETVKAHSGDAIAAFWSSRTPELQYFECINTRVRLEKGKKYKVSFWAYSINHSYTNGCENNVGFGFSHQPIVQKGHEILNAKPKYTLKIIDHNIRAWEEHSFYILPAKTLNYLTIGTFDYFLPIDDRCEFYTLIDDIEIIEVPKTPRVYKICEGEELTLKPTIETAFWFDNIRKDKVLLYGGSLKVSPKITTMYVEENDLESDSILVEVYGKPKIHIGYDTAICHGDEASYIAQSSTNSTLLWNNGVTGSEFRTKKAGTYILEAHENGCKATDTVVVHRKLGCDFGIELPNIFTPNNDGKNDFFVPMKRVGVASLNLKVHNRWGKEVFGTADQEILWDGSDVDDGLYFWSLEYRDYDDILYREKGTVEIRR